MEALPDVYPLTGLQIGDIQSYVSQAFVYFAPFSKRVFILVDNRPWAIDQLSQSAKLWQIMVAKYRMSPFMNTKMISKCSDINKEGRGSDTDHFHDENSTNIKRWLALKDTMNWKQKYLHSVMDLTKALHGFIVFELAWKDVHGINYLNELQIDTSLALEVRSMKKWEFYSSEQASNCISIWFSGRMSEVQFLKNYLKKLSQADPENSTAHSFTKEMMNLKSSPLKVLPEDEFLDVLETPVDANDRTNITKLSEKEYIQEKNNSSLNHRLCRLGSFEKSKPWRSREVESETFIKPTQYADTLILFRFNDSLLPSKLQQIIMSDIRLLTLLESGLPSWVIFLQSYPLFCHFYRPWMRPLAKTLYILVSLVTVMIGFYDLYKHVPLLKTTAARLCGPYFNWIEEWDMVTRIRYLGTMLFLKHLQKCLRWVFIMAKAIKSILVTISEPLFELLSVFADFFAPFLNVLSEAIEIFSSTGLSIVTTIYNPLQFCFEAFFSQFESIYEYTESTVYPLFCNFWRACFLPIRFVAKLSGLLGSLLSNIYAFFKDMWETVSSIFELTYLSETQQSSYDISALKELWNDLFSQIFRAVRSIINVLVAFLTTCNRHRLSINNHIRTFIQDPTRYIHRKPSKCHCNSQRKLQSQKLHEDDCHECDLCK